jgi:hypothetical protein
MSSEEFSRDNERNPPSLNSTGNAHTNFRERFQDFLPFSLRIQNATDSLLGLLVEHGLIQLNQSLAGYVLESLREGACLQHEEIFSKAALSTPTTIVQERRFQLGCESSAELKHLVIITSQSRHPTTIILSRSSTDPVSVSLSVEFTQTDAGQRWQEADKWSAALYLGNLSQTLRDQPSENFTQDPNSGMLDCSITETVSLRCRPHSLLSTKRIGYQPQSKDAGSWCPDAIQISNPLASEQLGLFHLIAPESSETIKDSGLINTLDTYTARHAPLKTDLLARYGKKLDKKITLNFFRCFNICGSSESHQRVEEDDYGLNTYDPDDDDYCTGIGLPPEPAAEQVNDLEQPEAYSAVPIGVVAVESHVTIPFYDPAYGVYNLEYWSHAQTDNRIVANDAFNFAAPVIKVGFTGPPHNEDELHRRWRYCEEIAKWDKPELSRDIIQFVLDKAAPAQGQEGSQDDATAPTNLVLSEKLLLSFSQKKVGKNAP